MATIAEAIQLAIQARNAGQISDAKKICQQILSVDPRCANAWHLLGVIRFQAGEHAEAAEDISRAVAIFPTFALAHNNLGNVLMALGRRAEAVAAFRRATELDSNDRAAMRNLGFALKANNELSAAEAVFEKAAASARQDAGAQMDLGQIRLDRGKTSEAAAAFDRAIAIDERLADAHLGRGTAALKQGDTTRAIVAYQRCIQLKPDHAAAHNNLGNAWIAKDEPNRAIECFKNALAFNPQSTDAMNNLAVALLEQGDAPDAVTHFLRVVESQPNNATAYRNLGEAYRALNRLDSAHDAFKKSIALNPNYAEAQYGFASLLRDMGSLAEAESAYRRAIALRPDYAEAFSGLGTLLRETFRTDEAAEAYREASRLQPNDAKPLGNALLLMQYLPGVNLESLAAAHREFETRHAAKFRDAWTPHKPRASGERLRVGFVSPDLGLSPVGFLLIGGFVHFDRTKLHITCYSDRKVTDHLTERFRGASDQWHDTRGWSDDRVAAQIRADRIDILYDLAGHTARSRMLLFARKPAPIQVSWLGYEGTTGVAAIDFILGDTSVIPPEAEQHYPERVLRFPETYVCYEAPADAPAVTQSPALSRGEFTFGCFNNPTKINGDVIAAWSQILHKTGQSRLFLKYRGLDDSTQQARLLARFSQHGISANRLLFEGKSSHADYFAAYGKIDLALDPFPFCGGVTSCEALWMGVPVLTCPGNTFAGRHTLSFLRSIGLHEWIASDPHNYVDRAAACMHGVQRLENVRRTLREKMAASSLCDGPRFARHFLNLQSEIIEAVAKP